MPSFGLIVIAPIHRRTRARARYHRHGMVRGANRDLSAGGAGLNVFFLALRKKRRNDPCRKKWTDA